MSLGVLCANYEISSMGKVISKHSLRKANFYVV